MKGCGILRITKTQEKQQRKFLAFMVKVRGAYDKFPDFFRKAFTFIVDSWKISMLLLYILWDDGPIFMISASNEQLQQQ